MGYYWRSTQYLFSPIRVMFGSRLFSGLCLVLGFSQGYVWYMAFLRVMFGTGLFSRLCLDTTLFSGLCLEFFRVMFGTRLFSGLCLAFLGQGHNCYIAQLIYFCLPPSSKHSVYKIVSVGSLNNRFLKTKEILNVTPTLIDQRVPSKWVKTVSI